MSVQVHNPRHLSGASKKRQTTEVVFKKYQVLFFRLEMLQPCQLQLVELFRQEIYIYLEVY